ncbi:MAG TPA: glycine cleavage system protein GcvH [Mariprofundaceae bacterium]|nr:glycine cleavage system protein GcvH [Mariprofundaceae bacterium]
MSIPADLKYTKEHEWVRIEGDIATFGVTDHAQEALGDIVFVELPDIGREVAVGEPFAVVESVKAVSDVYAPAAGEVVEVNDGLEAGPEKVNEDPYGAGWIAKVKLSGDTAELLDAETYATYLEE